MLSAAAVETVVFFLLAAIALFASAQRLDWPMAWAFLLVNAAISGIGFLMLAPEVIRERSRLLSGARGEDVVLSGVMSIFLFPATWIVCGLDARHGWSPSIPPAVQCATLALFAIGYGVGLWAARANPFFSTVVRIQTERGHHVIDSGPYALVRHPGYAGGLIAHLALPIALGSLWGLVPAALGGALMILRALYEEQTLADELPGYRDYMQRVPWRLIPRVW